MLGAVCLSFPDLEDHFVRFTLSESKEGHLKTEKQLPVSSERFRNEVRKTTALTELDWTTATTDPHRATSDFHAFCHGSVGVLVIPRRAR